VTESRLLGTYLLGVEPLLVIEREDGLALSMLGVPAEFAAPLRRDGKHYRVPYGELAGAELTFEDGDPCPGGVLAGVIPFERAPDDAVLPTGRGLVPPALDLTPEEEERYRRLLEEIRTDGDGGWLDVDPPRWRFAEWLTRQNAAIFHGSPKPDIDVFAPIRSSVELMDHAGTGNLAAVYGTPHGLWAMWFAVLDRPALEGSIRNGVMRWTDSEGRLLVLYFFSVHHEHVGGEIWRPGTLYLLPRETFRANPLFPGGPGSSEWASPEELRPLKRIAVEPEDFPFRDQVGSHDDAELIEAERLAEIVLAKGTSARRIEGGIEIALAWDDELATVAEPYLQAMRRFTPDVERKFVDRDGAKALEIRGAPGFLQSLEASLRRLEIELSD
jgi:hypothetical protein